MFRKTLFLLALCLPSIAAAEKVDLVLIEKAQRRLTLLSGSREIAKYSVALGGAPIGHKQCEGDSKTPEGDYRISGRNVKSAFYRSLRISYPNGQDRQNAARLGCTPGGDIMIHGLPNGQGDIGAGHRSVDWTLGCIAVTNSEIEEIWKQVPDGTRVRILP